MSEVVSNSGFWEHALAGQQETIPGAPQQTSCNGVRHIWTLLARTPPSIIPGSFSGFLKSCFNGYLLRLSLPILFLFEKGICRARFRGLQRYFLIGLLKAALKGFSHPFKLFLFLFRVPILSFISVS